MIEHCVLPAELPSAVSCATGELTVEVTESGTGNKKQSKFNALKQLTSTIDGYTSSDAVTTVYTYDGRGLLDRVTVDGVETADMDYDIAGNRYQIDDQSSGLTQFVFDSLGQVTQKTDAKGQKTLYTYDVLGRLTQRIDGYLDSGSITNNWVYDTATNGKGLLQSRGNPYVSETFVYDTHSRLVNRRATFSVSGYPGNGLYSTHQSYDSKGRPSVTTYPNNVAVTQTYSSRGYPYQLKRGSALLEQVETMDAFGNVTREKYGSNLYTNRIFDPNSGRLTSIETGTTSSPRYVQDLLYTWRTNSTLLKRTDQRNTASDLVETFTYDSMNRVKYATTTGGASRTKQFLYDRKGNLTLHTSNVSGDVDITGYTYHSTDKNRLLSFSRSGVSNQLSYDANGNVTRYTRSGDDRFIDYNAANQATRITIGSSASTSSPAARDEYWYGPDGERLARKASWSGGGLKVSWVGYIPGVSMERVYPVHDGSTSYRDKMMPSENVLLRYVVQGGSSSVHTQYLHRDHLGSVESVTSGTSEIRSLAYDAFGARRSSNWSKDITSGELADVQLDLDVYTQHGYTDHEHLDRTGLIHMKGRIYDPEIGRFLQPDPFVQAPSYSQSHNRYVYTFNSPLSYTDPTGFTSEPQECVNGVGSLCGRANDDPLGDLIRRERIRRVLESYDQQINRGNTGVRRNSQTSESTHEEVHPILAYVRSIDDFDTRIGAALSAHRQIDTAVRSFNSTPDPLLSWIFGRELGTDALRLRLEIGSVLVPLRMSLIREFSRFATGDAQEVADEVVLGTVNDVATEGKYLSKAAKAIGAVSLPLQIIEAYSWDAGVEVPIECGAQFGSDICGVVSPP